MLKNPLEEHDINRFISVFLKDTETKRKEKQNKMYRNKAGVSI
jgi:hypothetical protein